MGQNIHAHIEVQFNGKWEHFSAPRVFRDYKLYSLMGSDRAEEGMSPVTGVTAGMPADASPVTAYCLELDVTQYSQRVRDTVHHINAEGIRLLQNAYRNARPEKTLFDTDLEESVFRCYIAGEAIWRHVGFDGVRIIYWFDN